MMNTLSPVRSSIEPLPAVANTSMQGLSAPGVSASLQSYLRDCVRSRLRRESLCSDSTWFRIRLYLNLGDEGTAAELDRDLRSEAIGAPSGLIALFGHLVPGLSTQAAMEQQLALMHRCDSQLRLLGRASESRITQLQFGPQRYAVLMLHEHADCLHRVMPCPMLVFNPLA